MDKEEKKITLEDFTSSLRTDLLAFEEHWKVRGGDDRREMSPGAWEYHFTVFCRREGRSVGNVLGSSVEVLRALAAEVGFQRAAPCAVIDGGCQGWPEHVWEGPIGEYDMGSATYESVTCSRCGLLKIEHDMMHGP